MRQPHSRRSFLLSAPLAAAAAGLPFAPVPLAAQATPGAEPFRLVTAETLASTANQLRSKSGTTNLIETEALPLTIVMQTEERTSAQQFEWHDHRDHIFQILEGSTVYELGGTPDHPHNTKPGEWISPTVTGSRSVTLGKGDMLVIPRGMPHKRTTNTHVTLILISDTASSPAK